MVQRKSPIKPKVQGYIDFSVHKAYIAYKELNQLTSDSQALNAILGQFLGISTESSTELSTIQSTDNLQLSTLIDDIERLKERVSALELANFPKIVSPGERLANVLLKGIEQSTASSTASSTESSTELSTESSTASSTESSTELSTESSTESSTELSTESSTESSTASSTDDAPKDTDNSRQIIDQVKHLNGVELAKLL